MALPCGCVTVRRNQAMGVSVDTQTLVAVLGAVGACLGAYVAIRADLARLHERVDGALAAATRAHERIDGLHTRAG